MNWFESFLNKPITRILRVDFDSNYELLNPYALFIMFDETNGLLIGAINDEESIAIEASSLPDIYDSYGIEYSETILNDLKPEDKLNTLLDQTIKEIYASARSTRQVKGDNFVMKDVKYESVLLQFTNIKVSFHNSCGGYLAFE